MELEVEGSGVRIPVSSAPRRTDVGRGTRLATSDRTISRRHVSFQLNPHTQARPDGEHAVVSFEVTGTNPVLVVTRAGEKQMFRRSESGELVAGDRISLSLKRPYFLSVKSTAGVGTVDEGVLDAVRRREQRTSERRKEKEREETQGKGNEMADVPRADLEEGGGCEVPDLSNIDPVKEFGFLVRGHEFDRYSRKIRDIKHWNWFLEEQGDSDDEDEPSDKARAAKRKGRKKAKRRKDDDEDWTGESEDEKAVAAGTDAARRSKYLTRLKEQKRQKSGSPAVKANQGRGHRLEEEEDAEDETLGGFIVKNGDEEEEEKDTEDGEEEEELEDDDDDD